VGNIINVNIKYLLEKRKYIMLYREIGKSGIKATVISLGTWAAGGDALWGGRDDDAAVEAIKAAIDSGINLIDTAPAYGFGHSERLVGKAIKGRRSELIISTKCGLWWNSEEGSYFLTRDGSKIYRNLSKKAIKQGAEESLQNLGTDYIDIFITHWQAVEPVKTPISETMEALLDLKKEGKIRAIGISNVTPDHVKKYLQYGQIDLIQEKYSMLTRENVENNLLPLCEKHNITLQAYTPLEQGLLTGKVTMDSVLSDIDVRNKIEWYKPEKRIKVITMLNSWKPLCEKYSCEIPHLVIAWTAAQSEKINVLCGGRKRHHVVENVKAGELVLDSDDIEKMRRDVENLH
jgi:methylglyoxal reductase